tara:strand:+ start:1164 stop:2726 length:1563 start_codon:yes stop_codon:yes gene_type:complete
MKRINRMWLALSLPLASLAAWSASSAQETRDAASSENAGPFSVDMVPNNVRQNVQRDPDRFLTSTIETLYTYNPSGTVTLADVARVDRANEARVRASSLVPFLSFDLNGDGLVTLEEADQTKGVRSPRERAALDTAFLTADADGNKTLSISEMVAYLESDANQRTRRRTSQPSPMLFDVNGDATVTPEEVAEAIGKIAEMPVLSAAEVRAKAVAEKRGDNVSACVLPAASSKADVVIVSGYEGGGVSTVAVGGLDRETSVGTLNIEAGTAPLYIFATAHDPVVWKLEGETQRVEKFVVQPTRTNGHAGAAVEGLPAGKVAFVPSMACGSYVTSEKDAKTAVLKARISGALGRSISGVAANYHISQLGVPSGNAPEKGSRRPGHGMLVETQGSTYLLSGGKPVLLDSGKGARAASDLRRYYADGIVQIDEKSLVSPSPVESYDVLPQQAGLVQLLSNGSLKMTPDGYYAIEKDIPRFPAGLSGGHSVKFLLRKGVKMPGGSPGHSTVLDEATGECLGVVCR